jgi:hypothetical protein
MTEVGSYPYNRYFRLKILTLCLNDTWMSRYGSYIIKPEYFEMDDENELAKAILEYRARYGRSPRDIDDVIELMDWDNADLAYEVFDGIDEWDTELASDFALSFAREQAAKLAILDSVDDVMSGNIQAAIQRMTEALEVGQNIDMPGIDPIVDVDKWLHDYWSDKVTTGWPHMDKILEGGLSKGEEAIIMGPANKGKSMALVNLGYAGASLGGGVNVVHFTHEMSISQTAKRYAARMTFRFPQRNEDLYKYSEELVDAARRLLKGKIRIIGGAKETTTIINHLRRLEAEDFEFGLIIDDYPDLVIPPRLYKERRHELTTLFEWFRQLANDFNVPFWGATQGNRASLSKEVITLSDIAEDIGKANVADIVVTLCQTYDEEQMNQCRLFMAKVRDGNNHSMIRCKYYGNQQAIISQGFVKPKKSGVQTDV